MSAEAAAIVVPVIEFEEIHKVYETGKLAVHALRDIDLRIDAGELVSIMGPSGSGKTTLMEILGCLSRPTLGRYRLNGRGVEEIDPDALARLRGEEIGFIFQSFNLLPRLTLADEPTGNLDTKTGDEILALLEAAHAEGSTVVVVTHDPRIGKQAPRQLTIRDGQIESDRTDG